MGLAKDQKHQAKEKTGKRGSANNERRLATFGRGNGTEGADWGGCNSEKMQGVVMRITALGGAVTFGLARDHGAHFLTLLLDRDKETLWFNGGADLDLELDGVLAKLDAME